jgi:hypothetical protein
MAAPTIGENKAKMQGGQKKQFFGRFLLTFV